MSATMDARELCVSIASETLSRCCKSDFKPMPPRILRNKTVSLAFECLDCGNLFDVKTGKSCRLNLLRQDEDEDQSDDDDLDGRRYKKQKKRQQTNGRAH